MKFIGFELSETSVEVSKKAAEKFQVSDVSFYCANAAEPLPVQIDSPDIVCCFSSFALEMMPRIFSRAADHMLRLSNDLVVFFEPVDELWSKDMRGWTSKMRVISLHRLRGLYPYLLKIQEKGPWKITHAERSKIGINPFNEMVEIRMKKRG